jgi:hypothetical protein
LQRIWDSGLVDERLRERRTGLPRNDCGDAVNLLRPAQGAVLKSGHQRIADDDETG